ncbi:MAG TPA: hypothetical protein VG937_32460 [Polyangiaceae bacterium]|nr:hypothetical protein [Polyangiaceae bacterium]
MTAFRFVAALGFSLLMGAPSVAHAWLLHEHTATGRTGLERMDAESRARFDYAWQAAVRSLPRLCTNASESGEKLYQVQGEHSYCVGFGVLTGLSADHSCSPDNLANTLGTEFLLGVLQQGEQIELKLREADVGGNQQSHLDAWHLHHIELQIADPKYLSRAEQNGAHFQLPRKPAEDLASYLERVASGRESSNGIALYVNYHVAALEAARAAVAGCKVNAGALDCPSDAARNRAFANAILIEAFAIHFLQDGFSAGHMMSPTGSRSERMGTHDYYCEHGVSAQPWSGKEYVAHGDSFLQSEDLRRVAGAVAASLDEFAAALNPNKQGQLTGSNFANAGLDACVAPTIPNGLGKAATQMAALTQLPRPILEPPGLPTFQKELGVYMVPLLGAALRLGAEDVGIAGKKNDGALFEHRFPLLVFGGIGMGVTAEGITDSSADGSFSAGLNLLLDARPAGSETGLRLGGGFNFHVPYYLIPGDVIPLAVVALFDSNEYLKIVRRASAGGLLDLQKKRSIFFGWKLQFMAGREGFMAWMPPPDQSDDPSTKMNEMKRPAFSLNGTPGYIKLALPALSLTALHANSDKVGLDAVWQLGYDLTYYPRSETFWNGAEKGAVYHGLFLAFSYRARRYLMAL